MITCVCKLTTFCSEECRAEGHDGCSGERLTYSLSVEPDQAERFFEKHLNNLKSNLQGDGDINLMDREIQKGKAANIFPLFQKFGADYGELKRGIKAGDGKAGDMYILASICGSRNETKCTESKADSSFENSFLIKSEHETNELACKYYRMAVGLGFHLAGYMLARRLLEKWGGTANYSTEAADLLERCWLEGDMKEAYLLLSENSRISKEIFASVRSIETLPPQIPKGTPVGMGGPNAASLILAAVGSTLENTKYCRYDKRPLICQNMGLKLMVAARKVSKDRQITPVFRYGRAGTGIEATRQAQGKLADGPRLRTVPFFRVGSPQSPPDCSEDRDDIYNDWTKRYKLLWRPFDIQCAHSQQAGTKIVCKSCLEDAKVRLSAVASGHYALSQHEEREEHGITALFITASDADIIAAASAEQEGGEKGLEDIDLTLQRRETFRAYSKADVNTYLYCLSLEKSGPLPVYSHPVFLAMDPNIFWPIIWHYGSIRTALLAAAPQLPWASLLPSSSKPSSKAPPPSSSSVYGPFGELVLKCGEESCHKLESLGTKKFSKCGKCLSRVYCCVQHQKEDWKQHKRECKKV